ncbi:hypothetical protein H5410_014689, partial [Solanum commersonii]
MTYTIDVHTSKKISQPLKLGKKSITKEEEKDKENEEKEEEKEKEKVKNKVKEKEKKKEKKVEVVSCDVKQQYLFEGFNIDDEDPIELIRDKDDHYLANCSNLEFKQLDFVVASPKKKDWFYVIVVLEYEDKIVSIIKGFSIPSGLPWHLTDDVYVPVNCNGEFHWVLVVIALKERCIKVYDSMSSSRTNKNLCSEIQKLSTMLPKYLKSSRFFEQKDN